MKYYYCYSTTKHAVNENTRILHFFLHIYSEILIILIKKYK